MAYPVPPNLPPEVCRFTNPNSIPLPSGLQNIDFPVADTYNSPVITGGVGGFKCNVSGLYNVSCFLPVTDNGTTWAATPEKQLYLQVTRGLNTAVVLGVSSDEDSGAPYVLNLCGIIPLQVDDVIQVYHDGTHAGGPNDPETLPANPPFDGVFIVFTFVKSI